MSPASAFSLCAGLQFQRFRQPAGNRRDDHQADPDRASRPFGCPRAERQCDDIFYQQSPGFDDSAWHSAGRLRRGRQSSFHPRAGVVGQSFFIVGGLRRRFHLRPNGRRCARGAPSSSPIRPAMGHSDSQRLQGGFWRVSATLSWGIVRGGSWGFCGARCSGRAPTPSAVSYQWSRLMVRPRPAGPRVVRQFEIWSGLE